jgi:GT2 family glycosyltransferase
MGMVSIITVNFNQTDLTCALLESIRLQEYRDLEVIVVDNGSAENPAATFLTRFPEVQFLRSNQNLGFAGGNNLALPQAKGDYLFFVNNDAEIAAGCIAQLVHFLEKTPKAGIVSPLICFYDGRLTADGGRPEVTARPPSAVRRPPAAVIQYAGMPRVNRFTARSNMDGHGIENRGQYNTPFPTGYAHGAAMMIPKKVLEAVGPMHEDYFLYYEEVDWCERIRRAGFSVWVAPAALVWHKESMTMQGLGAAKTYYLSRNRIWFMKRHYGGLSFVVFALFMIFATVPKYLFGYLLKGDWKNMRAFFRGIKDGFMNITRNEAT